VVAHDRDDINDNVERVRQVGALYLGPRQYRRKDGTMMDVEVSVNVISHGGRELFCIVSRDITERSRLEEQLRQSQKMEAIGKLAGGVAHDFNNMLCVIDGHAEMLLAQMDEHHAAFGDLLEISKAATRASDLTRQLLAFSRKQVVQERELDLNQNVQGMEKLLRRLIGEDIELKVDLDPSIGMVLADPGQVEQVVMNLVVNARDAMPSGGTVLIRTHDVMDGAELFQVTGEVRDGRWLELEVTDSGCGMDRETRDHLFEPFFTTKRQGTGLGLATVYGVVQQAGGSIEVISRPDEGATFRILLPCLEPEESVDEVSMEPNPEPAGSGTILVVEDEPQTRKLVIKILTQAGYRVLEAADAEQALSLTEDQLMEVDLLLTDVVMPGVSGPQLAAHLLQQYPAWRVLFMSGYAGEEIARHGLGGADAPLLPKPFKPVDLTEQVKKLLERDPGTPQ
jgi:signal transduction histidine kinase/ActR/RegA family two-component response regulator